MKEKIVGIFVCMLLMFTAFSAVATTSKQEKSSLNQNTGHRGGLFTQLPKDPGFSSFDWYSFWCANVSDSCYQCYEMFTDVASPIRGIHWWGHSMNETTDGSMQPSDPVGMTFTIAFYKDNNTKPGEMVLSYNNVKPSITATGIPYSEFGYSLELYFFEYDLTPSCNLSTGWVSIFSTGSDHKCSLRWMESSTGNHNAFTTKNGTTYDAPGKGFSLVLTDGAKTSLEIVKMKGGLGVTLGIKNNGNATVDNYPVDFILKSSNKKINVNAGKTISGLASGATTSLKTGMFWGRGIFTIFVVGDGIAAYKQGKQLFVFTIVQK